MSEMIPNLFITNQNTALLLGNTVDLVVNCTPNVPFAEGCREMIRIAVDDDPSESLYLFKVLRDSNALNTIHNTLERGKKVIVHCQVGAQRSPAVVACYLIKFHNASPSKAVAFIKTKRPIAFFGNVNFQKTLDMMYTRVRCMR